MGGAHGMGQIGCDGYYIGKYPSINRVYNEWKLIAEAWHFLKLRCQLWNTEYGESSDSDSESIIPTPIVEFIIQNGTVATIKPKKVLKYQRTIPLFNPLVLTTNGLNGVVNCLILNKRLDYL